MIGLFLCLWLACGLIAARVFYKDMEQFHLPYDGLDVFMMVYLTLLGPVGLIVAAIMWRFR